MPGIALGPGDHTMVGRWLYYHQVATDGQLQLFRRIAPDGQPQLLWSAPPLASGVGSYFAQPSADGEAFYICPFSAPTCQVVLPDAVAPIEVVSSDFVTISLDDKWVFSACILYDVTGASRNLGCDGSQLFPSFSQDVSRLAIAFKGGAKVFTLATGEETVLPPAAQPIVAATLTPDGKRIVGFSNAGTFVASVSDGPRWAITGTSDLGFDEIDVQPDRREDPLLDAREQGDEAMRKRPSTRYGRRRGEGVKTAMSVAIRHGWKESMNVTPWDYVDRELTRLKREAMPALERARMNLEAALKAFAAAGGHIKTSPRLSGSHKTR